MFSFLKSSYQKVKNALLKTRSLFGDKIRALFTRPLNAETIEEFERLLYEADLGSRFIEKLLSTLRNFSAKHPTSSSDEKIRALADCTLAILPTEPFSLSERVKTAQPFVIFIVGINGSGKTTSVAKLAAFLKAEGKSVMLAAGDTFRAAATDQLTLWAKKVGVDIVKGQPGGDPAAVVFDALTAAKARGIDVVLIDTAGRLQSKTDLMHELAKMRRTAVKVIPEAPHETFLVLDATTGQNGIDQAKTFHTFTPLTGVILTKLDGSAKGGIVVSIYEECKIPIRFIGVGEQSEDLLPFDAKEYVDALFGLH